MFLKRFMTIFTITVLLMTFTVSCRTLPPLPVPPSPDEIPTPPAPPAPPVP